MTTRYRLQGILGHMPKGVPEYVGDSDRGLRDFARRGCPSADGNGLLSRDGKAMNTHYPEFQHHGFVRRDGQRSNTSLPVHYYLARELRHDFWTRHGHYTIDYTINRIELAFRLGMDYEFEPKEHMPWSVARTLWTQVTDLREEHPDRQVIVKTLNGRPGTPAYDLKVFHEAGFETLISSHRPWMRISQDAQRWITYYRGFKPRWV